MTVMALTGREKATILLSLLGSELSAKILKKLPEEYSDLITSGINNLPSPSAELIGSVLNEFTSFMSLPGGTQRKAIEVPLKAPPQTQQQPSEEPSTRPQPARGPVDTLFYSQPKNVAVCLSAERASVAAYVLSLLPPVQAREVLSFMPERKKEIESLLRSVKKPPAAEQIKETVIKVMSERLQRLSG